MKTVLFYHSAVSDWNHGNAHFLRGIAAELAHRGHDVCIYEPEDSWSMENLLRDHGEWPVWRFRERFPRLKVNRFSLERFDPDELLDDASLVLVHEWNPPRLVKRIGEKRKKDGGFLLFFHDTHHRMVTGREEMEKFDLSGYDGVLAFGDALKEVYTARGWASRVWTWHEAADTRVFKPITARKEGDLVWIGNWGDGERTEELTEFLLRPAGDLRLKARAYGVRYPEDAIASLASAGIEYAGWVPNYDVPEVFARFRVTVHVPRRPYTVALPGIPTIRPFEAMACGIPLVSSPWDDAEGLFTAGKDYLAAKNGEEMKSHLRDILNDREMAETLSKSALDTIRQRHTCSHRADELMAICGSLGLSVAKKMDGKTEVTASARA